MVVRGIGWLWAVRVCQALTQAVHAQTGVPSTPSATQPAPEPDEWNVLGPDLQQQERVLNQSQPTSNQQPAPDTNAMIGEEESGWVGGLSSPELESNSEQRPLLPADPRAAGLKFLLGQSSFRP